ncbi:MAG: type II toxin-antitoxin system RelE/ParE family toxin [Pseudomonadota bacterium]|nr:type II toxin-antitoxin system RelE/ParE family toxin [Pseudomonadota bacterium]
MKLLWTHRARRDLIAIGRYIARDSPAAARQWVEQLRQRMGKAAETPLAGRVVPELGQKEIREVFLRNYRIVYRVQQEAVVILTVFEGHRLLRIEALSDSPPSEGDEPD